MSTPGKFRFISSDRRVREDRRFVVGKGNFAADIVPQGVKHVALVTCPHPAAKIVSIDKSAALAMPGVHYVLDGAELAGATNVLVTLGAEGVFAATDDGVERHFPAIRVKAVDTTAAGDVFVGGFVASLAAGRSIADAVGFGQAAASISVPRHGAQPSIPRFEEIIRQDA